MDKLMATCGVCAGIGHKVTWEIVSEDAETNTGTAQRKETICESCNGKGYTEYAGFSIEEAEAILKYCGLNKE